MHGVRVGARSKLKVAWELQRAECRVQQECRVQDTARASVLQNEGRFGLTTPEKEEPPCAWW